MCCRYFFKNYDKDLGPLAEKAAGSPLIQRFRSVHPAPLVQDGEVFPGDLVPVVASNRQKIISVFPMLWGFSVAGRSAKIVNARVETAAEKPSFRDAWRNHRCIIPASWYYEWQKLPEEQGSVKIKYAIRPKDSSITCLCGLYRLENGLPTFVILTAAASEDLAHIHDRMPLILPKSAVRAWIHPETEPEKLLSMAISEMTATPTDP